jgi:putative MATE family efflux protein
MKLNLLTSRTDLLFWRLSVPAVLGMIAASSYQFVDSLFVGRWVGLEALSAVSLSYMIVLVFNGAGSLIGTGASSILSRAVGEGDRPTQKSIYPMIIYLTVLLSGVLIPLVLMSLNPIFTAMTNDPRIINSGTSYMRIIVIGIPFSIGSSAVSMAIRAEGKIVTSVTVITAGSLLNIILDPLFIKVSGLGLKGSAIATVLSQVISFIICVLWLQRTHRLFREMPKLTLIPTICKIGVSGVMMNIMTLIQLAFVYGMIGRYGTKSDIAVLGTCMLFLNLAFVPLWGISQALQPVLGINYGAGQVLRVNQSFHLFSCRAVCVSSILWGIMEIFPSQLLGWFIKDQEVVLHGVFAFRMIFGLFLFYGFFITLITLFQAIGKVKNAILLMFGRMLVVFLPVLLITSNTMKVNGIWAAFPITDAVILLMGAVMFYRFKHKYLLKN